jgi:hypothetical protein
MPQVLARLVAVAVSATSLVVHSWYELRTVTTTQMSSDLLYRRIRFISGLFAPKVVAPKRPFAQTQVSSFEWAWAEIICCFLILVSTILLLKL